MALYKLLLIDLGYEDENGVLLDTIEGRDNVTLKFRHRGYVYPHPGPYVREEGGEYIVIESATPIEGATLIEA